MTLNRRHILKLSAPFVAAAFMAAPAYAGPVKAKPSMDMSLATVQSFAAPELRPEIRGDAVLLVQAKVSAAQAKAIARRRHPDAKFNNISRKGNVYVVRLIKKDGRVVDVFVDAQSGRVR